LVSAYGLAGEGERAAVELAEARQLSADDARWSVAHARTFERYQAPEIRALFDANVIAGWRKAELPEQWAGPVDRRPEPLKSLVAGEGFEPPTLGL
jgi:hypothetical protein